MNAGQPVRVKTTVGDQLVLRSMDMVEELSRLYSCELQLFGENEELNLDDLLGQDMTVEIDLPNEETRYVHGIVSEMQQTGRQGGRPTFTALLRPWFWFLTRRADCRIFQEMTVQDIISQVFGDLGFSDYEFQLSGSYRTWEYCVQYRESDFNFVSRLMEQEGMYYYFLHEDGKHILRIVDDSSAHSALPHYDTIPFVPPDGSGGAEERISSWALSKSVTPGKYSLGAFYFKDPGSDLLVEASNPHSHVLAEYDVFDYPGEYYVKAEGDSYVKARLQECQVRYERYRGETDCRGMFAGGYFKLDFHPIDERNKDYLVVSTHTSIQLGDHRRTSADAVLKYKCWFETMDLSQPFRAERITPKPVVQGPQTAIVTGPSSEEIHTDEFGRVKIFFRWDRYGEMDENSSCWVRVAQVWAGSGWGGMTIPRIGQEVIVSFIEGDPDRPIITGRVYNQDNMPPYGLPANKTRSTLKSQSSKGGSTDNANEIRFEDKKGSEELFIQAEKDETITVKNDKTENVGANETITIGKDRQETVQGSETITVVKDRTETVQGSETLTVVKDRTRNVTGSETVNVARTRTHNVSLNESINVGAAQEIVVGGFQALEVGAFQNFDIGANQSVGIGRNQDVDVGKNRTVSVGEKDDLKVGKEMVIDVGDQLTIKCGKASITLKKDGSVSISGKDLTLKASGKIGIKASSDVTIKGSKVQAN